MNKLVASVGLVALGASAVHLSAAQGLTPDTSKPWTVSATLRGFYDDNFNTAPDDASLGGYSRESMGWEIAPSAVLGWNLENTVISLGYTYSYKYYENEFLNSTDHDSQSHIFNALVNHAFSERNRLTVKESFAMGQEPDVLRAGNTYNTFQRVSGDNYRNAGTILFDTDLTPLWGMQLGYDNVYYNYADDGTGSYSAALDRIENYFHIDGKYKLSPQTDAIFGYQYGMTLYTSDDEIAAGTTDTGEVRNSRSHYLYVGGDHTFSTELTGSLRVGARFIDFYNDPNDENGVSPYLRISGRYMYAEESFIEAGVSYDRSTTDLIGFENGDFTTDANTATVFASVTHRITPKLFGTILGQFQNSTYNNGDYNNDAEQFYLLGLNLEYNFNRHFAANAGYSFDALSSDSALDRSFTRNRIYIGITAQY